LNFWSFYGGNEKSINPPAEKLPSLPVEDNDPSEYFPNDERMIFEHGQTLLSQFERKPDCFKEATTALKDGCKSLNLSDNDKIQYAVRLTKCKLAIANFAAPMECEDINYDVGRCVEAISKIPQLWVTYDRYHNEACTYQFKKMKCYYNLHATINDHIRLFSSENVVQMCVSVRCSVKRDSLEEIHRIISVIYKILKHQQNEKDTCREEEMKQIKQLHKELKEMMFDNTGSLKKDLSDSQLIARSISNLIIHFKEEFEKFSLNMRETFDDMNNANNQQLSILVDSEDMAQQVIQYLQKVNSVAQDTLSSQEQAYDNMEDIKYKHRELSNQWYNILQETSQNFHNLLGISQNEIQSLTKTLSDAREIHQDFVKILKPLNAVVDSASWLYDENLLGNCAIYAIPLLAIIHWMLFGKIIAIFGFIGKGAKGIALGMFEKTSVNGNLHGTIHDLNDGYDVMALTAIRRVQGQKRHSPI
ncbi:10540_t:CDS:10, partial [Funneliformis caledonium]